MIQSMKGGSIYIMTAIQRTKNMKDWPRAWKARPVSRNNPEWRDLYDDLS